MEFKRFAAVLMLVIMLIAIASVPVLASTNEKVIFKNSDNEYLIYYKEGLIYPPFFYITFFIQQGYKFLRRPVYIRKIK